MPRYTYLCDECEGVFNIAHSIKEKLEVCEECEGQLTRVPSQTFINTQQRSAARNHKVGDVVKNYIEETKKELTKEKNRLKVEEYK